MPFIQFPADLMKNLDAPGTEILDFLPISIGLLVLLGSILRGLGNRGNVLEANGDGPGRTRQALRRQKAYRFFFAPPVRFAACCRWVRCRTRVFLS